MLPISFLSCTGRQLLVPAERRRFITAANVLLAPRTLGRGGAGALGAVGPHSARGSGCSLPWVPLLRTLRPRLPPSCVSRARVPR